MPEDLTWRRTSTRLLVDRWPWLRLHEDDVTLPNGHQIDGFLRLEGRDYATIFAVTPDGEALFVRQFKYGPGRSAVQLPGGYLEEGEAAETAARRELLEETGFEAAEWLALGSFAVDGNRGMGRAHFFLARSATQVGPPDPGVDEDPELVLVPLAEVGGLLVSDEIAELSPLACSALALIRLGFTTPL